MAIGLLSSNNTTIVGLSNAIFGIAPGYIYLNNFSAYATQNGMESTANALAELLGQTNTAFKATLVANLGLTGDAATAAEAYFDSRFDAGASQGDVATEAVNYLLTPAAQASATYGTVATAFNATVVRSEIYSTDANNAVTDAAVLSQAAAGTVPQAKTLTAADDALSGGAGDDIFSSSAAANYAAARDTVDGGEGSDTLSLTMAAGGLTPQSLTSIEKLTLIMTDGGAAAQATHTVSMAKATGVEDIEVFNFTGSNNGSEDTVALTNLTASQTVKITDGDGEFNVSAALKTATGTSDTIQVTLDDASVDLVTLNDIETVSIISSGTASAGNVLASGLDADAMTTLNISGTAKVDLSAVEDTGKAVTINASQNSGGVIAEFAQNPLADTKALTITGSTGNDRLTFVAADIDGDTGTATRYYSVDFGDGTDTLAFSDATSGLTAANLKKGLESFSNYEAVRFNAAESGVNLATTGLQGKDLVIGHSGGHVFTNASSGVVVTQAVSSTSAMTVAFAGAGVKQATLNLAGFDTVLENGAGGVFAGVQNLVMTNTASTSTDVTVADIDDFTGGTLTLSGNGGISFGTDGLSVSTLTIAAADMTDSLTVVTSAQGTLINAGSGADTITVGGITVIDEIYGGAGADTIKLTQEGGSGGGTVATDIDDILNGGDGSDTLQLLGDVDDSVTTDLTDADLTGIEKLVIDDATASTTSVVTISAAQSVQFAGTSAVSSSELTAATGTDVAPTITVKMAKTDTTASGTGLVDTFTMLKENGGVTLNGLGSGDLMNFTAYQDSAADWSTAEGSAAAVNAADEWHWNSTDGILTIYNENKVGGAAAETHTITITGASSLAVTDNGTNGFLDIG